MPIYHFKISNDRPSIPSVGMDLPSLSAARVQALLYAGQLLKDAASSTWAEEEWTLTVTDRDKLTLFSIVVAFYDTPSTASSASADPVTIGARDGVLPTPI